jgi:hypothetical protein
MATYTPSMLSKVLSTSDGYRNFTTRGIMRFTVIALEGLVREPVSKAKLATGILLKGATGPAGSAPR